MEERKIILICEEESSENYYKTNAPCEVIDSAIYHAYFISQTSDNPFSNIEIIENYILEKGYTFYLTEETEETYYF